MGTSNKQTIIWLAVALIPIVISATVFAIHQKERSMRHVNVIIVPICNPGRSCEPSFPKQLRDEFFHHPRGVGQLLSKLLGAGVVVGGQVMPWIRATKKLKSSEEVLQEIPFIIEQINIKSKTNEYQIVLFTIDTPGKNQTIFWPEDQKLEINQTNIGQKIGVIINSSLTRKLIAESPILPSVAWLEATASILKLSKTEYQLCL